MTGPILRFPTQVVAVAAIRTMPGHVIVIISEDLTVRRQLAALLRAGGLGEALLFDSTRAFVEHYDAGWCGCLLLDLRISAYEAIRLLKQQQKVPCRMALVYFTVEDAVPVAVENANGDQNLRTFDGADPGGDLLARVHEALRRHDEDCVEASAKERLRGLYESTSRRERQVLERLARGCTNKEIAVDLDLSPRTVEIYRSRLQLKLQAATSADLVRLWTTMAADQARQARVSAGAR